MSATAYLQPGVRNLKEYRPSLGFPRAGIHIYRLDASETEIQAATPQVAAGTMLIFIRSNESDPILVALDANPTVTIEATDAGPINGSKALTIDLPSRGDTLILTADTSSPVPTWRAHTQTIVVE